MFPFEHLPKELQLEVLKNTEFQGVQNMKRVSKDIKRLIQSNQKHLKPMPVRQMLVTPEKISFTLKGSQEICTCEPHQLHYFVFSANVDMLWLEASTSSSEPIDWLMSLLPFHIKIECLKLSGSRTSCDVDKLSQLLAISKCKHLVIDWRFTLPYDFFDQLPLKKINGLTIGESSARQDYLGMNGNHLNQFRGEWLEIGPNRLILNDIIILIEDWISWNIEKIAQYNIVIGFPINQFNLSLPNRCIPKSHTEWRVIRSKCDNEENEKYEEMIIKYYPSTNFSNMPSLVFQQIES